MTKSKQTSSPTRSRDKVLQTLYEIEVGGQDFKKVLENHPSEKSNKLYVDTLKGVVDSKKEIDKILIKHIDRPIMKLDSIERNALRIAIYELINKETDTAVVINEAIRMSKKYGSVQGYKMVNAVLDNFIKENQTYA